MRHLKKNTIKWLIVTVIALSLIWGLGPYLAIGGKTLFESLMTRLISTALLIFAWCIYVTLYAWRQQPLPSPQQPNLSLGIIQRTLEAFTAIKKRYPYQLFKENKQPWILLLGETNAGKTSLLANSELTLHSTHHQSLKNISNTQSIDWWLHEEAVFIDPAGTLCSQEQRNKEWLSFLNLLKKHKRGETPLDALIVVINSTIFSQSEDAINTFFNQLSSQIQGVLSFNPSMPVTMMITQCDRISGFQEYFADLGPEERQQSLGFTLNENPNEPLTSEYYQKRFDTFLDRIGERLLWRLHHEQNLSRRSRIQDFPLQLEKLGSLLKTLINKLSSRTTISGIYFASSTQSGSPINLLMNPITKKFHLEEKKQPATTTRKKSYFIHAPFTKLIADKDAIFASSAKFNWPRVVSLPVAVLVVLVGVMLWHHAYHQNRVMLSMSETALINPKNDASWLNHLNTLQKTLAALKQRSVSHYRWLGLGQAENLQGQMRSTYQQLIRTNFVLYLDQVLTKQIQTNIDKHQPTLYSALETYLMLINPNHLNPDLAKNWFANYWAQQYPHDTQRQQQLMQHLSYLLTLKHLSWPTDHALIHQAQSILKKLPQLQIALMVLQGKYQKTPVPLFQGNAMDELDLSSATIPPLYSANHFDTIYHVQIPHIAATVEKGNWVIGEANSTPSSRDSTSQSLTAELQAAYIKHYIEEWQTGINHITLTPPQHLSQALDEIRLITDNQSPLWELLKNITENASVKTAAKDEPTNSAIILLQSFLQKGTDYQAMQRALQNLNQFLVKIVASPAHKKAAYEAAMDRMKNNSPDNPITHVLALSQTLPAPMNQWMKSLATQSWKILLSDSRDFLNTQWTSHVLPEYNSNIANQFPIFSAAKQDISVSNFNHFFGPGGTLQAFFNQYLEPFVDTDKVYWTWKSIDGQPLPVDQAKLDMFIRASMIQKMFYTDSSHSPSFQFDLTPIDLSSNISRFILNISGQMISFEPGIKKTNHLTWPGSDGNFVTMRFNTLSAQKPTVTKTGDWAWLHLLDQSADIQTTQDPTIFQVTFRLNNNEAHYQLKADNPVNPYQPQLLNAFRCAAKL